MRIAYWVHRFLVYGWKLVTRRGGKNRQPASLRPGRYALIALRSGITLIELLVVMTVLAIIVLIMLPSLADSATRMRLDVAANSLAADLTYTRSEAVKRNLPVYLAKLNASTYNIEYVDLGGTVQVIGSRSMSEQATITAGPDTVRFASFGAVLTGGATYTLSLTGLTRTVRVSAAGQATVE